MRRAWLSPPAAAISLAVAAAISLAVAAAIALALAAGAASVAAEAESVAAKAASATAREWVIESFDVEIRVRRSGRIDVTETIRPRFTGSFKGIYRTIPIRYRDRGFNYRLLLDVEEVTDGSGSALRYDESREGAYKKIKIWVPGAADATRTVQLRYSVQNGLRFPEEEGGQFETWDELYWNVTGDEWPVPIERASAQFVLPVEVTGLRAVAYTGAYGSTEQTSRIQVVDYQVRVVTTQKLASREGLTVAVAWDPGVVERPGATARVGRFLKANWPLFLPVAAFVLMFLIWRARGRDPDTGAIAAQYEPPDGLTPGEVGVLVDHSPDIRDVTATLVDLAVRGYLSIEEGEKKQLFGLLSEVEYTFKLEKPREEWTTDGLRTHERRLLDALFGSTRTSVELSELQNEFYQDLPKIRNGMFERLLKRRYYARRPDKVKAVFLGGAVVVTVLILILGNIVAGTLEESPFPVILAAVLSGLIVAGFGLVMPARTVRGARSFAKVLGFQEFLQRVESDRFKRMIKGPEMFEKFLPFAMALGVEKNWAAAFEDIYREPPGWYHGSDMHGFRTGLFVNDLSRMTTHTSQTMTSRPRSSGGSGFGGGGGFSGGGFGGGGGGAF